MEENSKMILSLALTGFSVCAMGQQPIHTSTFSSKETPNILVIVCEDISPYLGCYGDNVAVSPYLDQFAEQAVLHTDMYTCVGVSAPSRYSLITGRYSSADGANYMRANYFNKQFGVVPPAGVKCYTELLRKKGYYCTNNSKTDYQFPNPVSAWDEHGEKAHWKNAPVDAPFFSIFNLNVTHESFIWKNTSRKVLNQMRAAYRKEWIKPFNSDWETKPEAYFVEKMWPKGEKPRCEKPRLHMKSDKVFIDNNLDVYSAIYRIKAKTEKSAKSEKQGMTEVKENWSLYTEPISLEKGDCIVVKLERIGYTDSAPVEFSL